MWEERYQANTTPWRREALNPAFLQWFAPEVDLHGKNVLIPGCGTSQEPLAFAQRGALVTAVDLAPSPVAYQDREFRTAGCSATFICTDFLAWQPDQTFDIVYEQTCLCAIPPASRPTYEQRVRNLIRPGGLLYALFMQTISESGPPFHCDLTEMRELFTPGCWTWMTAEPLRSEHTLGIHELGCILMRSANISPT